MTEPLRFLRSIAALASMQFVAAPAWSYRPFDSTDANVASEDELEVEFGFSRSLSTEEHVQGWDLVLNYGLGRKRELVVEGARLKTAISGLPTENSFADVALSLKQIVRTGSLQGESGISVATECGALFPTTGEERGMGGECAVIASQASPALSVHLNAAVAYDRDHEWRHSIGVIVEGAEDWKFRPGFEILNEHEHGEGSEWSGLVGIVWQASESVAADVAYRHSLDSRDAISEWRVGLTWSLPT
jgi:hypothetical protein